MPLTLTRPVAARLLGWSEQELNRQTETGEIAVVWTGKRRKIAAGELARIGQMTIAELADRYEAMQQSDDSDAA